MLTTSDTAASASPAPQTCSHEVVERLSQLAALLLPTTRSAFHAFSYRGEHLVYDLLSGSILSVTAPLVELLRGIEARENAAAIRARLPELDDEAVLALIAELEQVHAAGFLRTEDTSRAAAVEALVAQSLVQQQPRKMMLMVQSNCNLKCTYCYEVANGFHSTGTRMDLETGKRSVEFLIQRSGTRQHVEITFFGGEPLMNFPLIRELVAYCKQREAQTGKRFAYQLTTNATLLTDEIIAYLVEHQFAVMVSLDGPPELNDRYRVDLRGRGTGATALANARKLAKAQRAAGVREAMIRVTMTHENHDSHAIDAFLRAQGFRRIMLGSSNGRADHKDAWDIQPEDLGAMREANERSIDAYVAWLDGKAQRADSAAHLDRAVSDLQTALRTPSTAPSIRCGVGRNMQAISRDGKIYPCHRYAGDAAFELGTLEQGLDEQKVRSYYDGVLRVKEEHCSKCWARITCGGQCPWYISTSEGAILHPDEASCEGIRRGHERLLYLTHRLHAAGRLADARGSRRSRRARNRRAAQQARAALDASGMPGDGAADAEEASDEIDAPDAASHVETSTLSSPHDDTLACNASNELRPV